MRSLTGAKSVVLTALLLTLAAAPSLAAPKPRNVLIVPFAGTDLSREEPWIGGDRNLP